VIDDEHGEMSKHSPGIRIIEGLDLCGHLR
jgi:hypothetical protein